MNVYETERIKKKIDSVLDAADEFNTQSAQLNEAKKDFTEYVDSIRSLNDKLADVIMGCEEYVEAAKNIVKENEKIAEAATTRAGDLPDRVDAVKQLVDKDHIMILASCIASAIAAIAAIIGLFV